MRTDFNKSSKLNYKRKDSKWPAIRIIRAVIFLIVGLLVGYAISLALKQEEDKPVSKPQAVLKSEKVTLSVDLPKDST